MQFFFVIPRPHADQIYGFFLFCLIFKLKPFIYRKKQ